MARRRTYRMRMVIGLLSLAVPVIALTGLLIGLLVFHLRGLGPHAAQLWLLATAAIGAFGLAVLILGRTVGWIGWRWLLVLAAPAAAPLVAAGVAAAYLRAHPSTPEVATDLIDPPAFEGAAAAPFAGGDAQVRTLVIALPPAAAYERVQALVAARPGWQVTASQAPVVLQGTAVIGRFAYKRDWVVRLRPELAGGSLVDMRIRSKPDEPDFGDNAATVDAFLKRLAAEGR